MFLIHDGIFLLRIQQELEKNLEENPHQEECWWWAQSSRQRSISVIEQPSPLYVLL